MIKLYCCTTTASNCCLKVGRLIKSIFDKPQNSPFCFEGKKLNYIKALQIDEFNQAALNAFGNPLLPILIDNQESYKGSLDILNYFSKFFLPCDDNKSQAFLQCEVLQWITMAFNSNFKIDNENLLQSLDEILEKQNNLVGNGLTLADIVIYFSLSDWMAKNKSNTKIQFSNLYRWCMYIQQLTDFSQTSDKTEKQNISLAIPDLPEINNSVKKEDNELEKKSDDNIIETEKDKTKKNKKEKTNKTNNKQNEQKNIKEERPIDDITRLDFRVGYIRDIKLHPDADRCYIEQIDIGESQNREIVSGLKDHININNLINSFCIIIANMKPKKVRGITSNGMIICASNGDKVEVLRPAEGTQIGERVFYENIEMKEADEVLSVKEGKNPFLAVQPSLNTDDDFIACYKNFRFKTSKGYVTCQTIKQGQLS